MDVYDFLNTFTDLCGCIVTIFDCDSEEIKFDSRAGDCYGTADIVGAIEEADLDGYDVQGVDIFNDFPPECRNPTGYIHIEINISMGDEEDE